MASYGTFQSDSFDKSGGYYGELYVDWTSEKTSAGKTTVNWTLSAKGRENKSGKSLKTTATVTINGTQVYNITDTLLSYNNNEIKSGSFQKQHDSNGDASFEIKIVIKKKYVTFNSAQTYSKTISLDENMPYSYCAAPSAASITLSPAIQKPGGQVTISWDAGTAGTGMSISKYQVQYQIGSSGNWIDGGYSTTTSKKITLPTDASRGGTITAKVKTIGSVSGYDSSYTIGSGTSKVNRLPSAPTANANKVLVPSSGGAITFTLSAGSTGTGESQTASIYYATSTSGTKTVCSSGFKPTVTSTTTYYFWTYDGLEYSSSYAQIKITVNSKPTLDFSISGDSTSHNQTVTFSKGSNGQSSGNKYTFGFTCNNTSYTLVSAQTSTTYTIGDMRKRLSDKLGYLDDNTTYSYSFWAKRNDGIETSKTVTKSAVSISIPRFALVNEHEKAAPFSKKVTVTTSGTATGLYTSVGFSGATTNGLVLTTTNLAYGTTLDKLKVNDSFYVKPATTLHKVYEIDITPSSGRSSPYDPTTFSSYTTEYLNISLLSQTGSEYGLSSPPQLILKNKTGTEVIGTYGNWSTDNATYLYAISGTTIYPKINTGNNSVTFILAIKNEFGDEFSKEFTLPLNNTMAAIPYISTLHSLDLYPGTVDNSKYPSLNSWKYLKEEMPIYCDFSVLAFDKPVFDLEVYNLNGSQKWESLKSDFYIESKDYELTSYGDYKFNTPPAIYYVSSEVIKINEVLSKHEIQFRMKITTISNATIYNFFNGESIPVEAHYGAHAYFTKVSYLDSTLNTEWIVEDQGFTSENGALTHIEIQTQEDASVPNRILYPNTPEYAWKPFDGFKKDENNNYEYLHIAPKITTELKAKTKDGKITAFPTEKFTSLFSYTVVYNITPTVSYRKNHLGINASSPSQYGDAVLTIKQHNTRDCIYLIGASSEQEHLTKISLSDGSLSGFVVDCGSWTNIPGGIIPSNPDVPTGLAQIAYTGEIGDLQQNRTDIIVITGGGAQST